MRHMPLHAPQIGPCFCTARIMYSLQLGLNRHNAGKIGRQQT
jgi:hypothetical protein